MITTKGTNDFLLKSGLKSSIVKKVKDGSPNIIDFIKENKIDLVINTTFSSKEIIESFSIRRTSLVKQIPYFTTLSGAIAGVDAIEYMIKDDIKVKPLQDYF